MEGTVGKIKGFASVKFVESDCLCGIFIEGVRKHSRRGVHPFLPLIDNGGTEDGCSSDEAASHPPLRR